MNKITSEAQERAFIEAYREARKDNPNLDEVSARTLKKCYWLALTTMLDLVAVSGEGGFASMPAGYGKFEVQHRKYSGVNLGHDKIGGYEAYRVHYAPGELTKWKQ